MWPASLPHQSVYRLFTVQTGMNVNKAKCPATTRLAFQTLRYVRISAIYVAPYSLTFSQGWLLPWNVRAISVGLFFGHSTYGTDESII